MEQMLIIFPSCRQMDYLVHQSVCMKKIYVLTNKCQYLGEITSPYLVFLKNEDTEQIQKLKAKKLSVLCCHEEAIYWLTQNDSPLWHLQFSREYLKLIEKQNFKNFLNAHHIRNAAYVTELDGITCYPVVAKPSIGFGSIGVRTVSNCTEAKKYVDEFETMLADSFIFAYQKKYFPNVKNQYLFEEKKRGLFFRTPVIVNQGYCRQIFPIQGITRVIKNNSEYHWEEFELNLMNTTIATHQMKEIMEQLILLFQLAEGVYIAEFIQEDNGQVSLLEFSPRQASERINHMVYLASGIDMDLKVLLFFLHKDYSSFTQSQTKIVRLRLERHPEQFSPLPDSYQMTVKRNDISLYDRNMQLKYYVKHENIIL